MADARPPLVVFDCNVFAQALINRFGPAGRLVQAAKDGRLRLFVSEYALSEIAELPDKLPLRLGVTRSRADGMIRDIRLYAELIDPVPSVFNYDRDPDDAGYVDLAVASGATLLVTRDKDLLTLATDTEVGRAFATRFPDISVIDPVAMLALMPPTDEEQELRG